MYALKLNWKEFNLSLPEIETWIKANYGTNYIGNSADKQLTLWYSEEPSQETKDAIQTYWDALSEESTEAINYVSQQDIKDTIQTLRVGIPAKSWDDMSVAERKIVLGEMPTNAELGL